MTNVTYLLGAGASFDALPIVEQFGAEIDSVIKHLQTYFGDVSARYGTIAYDYDAELKAALEDLQFLRDGCREHKSVDTFARKFFLTNDRPAYRRVKCAIILFFELYQRLFHKVDLRYDSFLSSILRNDEPRLPAHVNIISWNYDYELERAYNKYIPGDPPIESAYKEMNVQHKGAELINVDIAFQMVKLNGTSGYLKSGSRISLGLHIDEKEWQEKAAKGESNAILKGVLLAHSKGRSNIDNDEEPAISFAWEEDTAKDTIEIAKEILRNTRIVVAIGYSFPFFNRKVDKMLFGDDVLESGELRQFYLQAPNAYEIIENLKGTVSPSYRAYIDFKAVTDKTQFYMPYELD